MHADISVFVFYEASCTEFHKGKGKHAPWVKLHELEEQDKKAASRSLPPTEPHQALLNCNSFLCFSPENQKVAAQIPRLERIWKLQVMPLGKKQNARKTRVMHYL